MAPDHERRVTSCSFRASWRIDDDGQLVGAGRWDVQAEQCLRRIERELGEHGARWKTWCG